MNQPAPPARLKTQGEVEAALLRALDPATTPRDSVPLLCAVLAVRPGQPRALAALASELAALGERDPQARAAALAARARIDHPALARATAAIEARDPAGASAALRDFMADHPEDPVALAIMGTAAARAGNPREGAGFLRRALAIAPAFTEARRLLVDQLQSQGTYDEAVAELDTLAAAEPDRLEYPAIKAATLKRMRRIDEALALYDTLRARHPRDVELLIDHGNALRSAGRGAEAAASFRAAARIDPGAGRAWQSLADLKTAAFEAEDIAAMEAALLRDDLAPDSRGALHFALGRALEAGGRPAEAFAHYASGNALQRLIEPYDPRALEAEVAATIALVRETRRAPEMTAPRGDRATPIFVLGLPRSGSTVIERILASHPQIEATEELPYVRAMAADLRANARYPDVLRTLPPEGLEGLRRHYLDRADAHRRRGAPFFVDKAPGNWRHLPLIAAVFPDARIVDARRHPLDCGFSNYAQRFGRGSEFSYSLAGIGHFTRLHADTMAAVAQAWPGRVHRIDHQALVDDPEGTVRALLDYVGAPFDPACLAFHTSDAPVFSASSEQVRRPLNRDGIGRWKPFALWLGPLERALGPALDGWPRD